MIAHLLFFCFSFGPRSVDAELEGYFWHIADLHWDPTYSETQVGGSCTGVPDPNSPYGSFFCDSPYALIESAMDAMVAIYPNPDFVIWTGDDTPHIYNDTLLSQEVVKEIIDNLTATIDNHFNATKVYPALGNHDWSPKSQLPPNPDPFYSEIAVMWQKWLSTDSANNTFSKGGYYSLEVNGNITIVVLNTNLYYRSNKLTYNMPDPANQLQWLDDTLSGVRKLGKKAMIIGHVPPGLFEKHPYYYWYYEFYNDVFSFLIRKHADVITGMHFGHHHTDTFRMVYTDDAARSPLAALFLAPAVAPWETTLPGVMGGAGNNPAVRLVKYNKLTGVVIDIEQYYLNLQKANDLKIDVWELEYKFLTYYNLADMQAARLHNLTEKISVDDDFFGRYYKANSVLYDPEEEWTEEMRIVHYCSMVHLDYKNYTACYDNKMAELNGASPKITGQIIAICLPLFTVQALLV